MNVDAPLDTFQVLHQEYLISSMNVDYVSVAVHSDQLSTSWHKYSNVLRNNTIKNKSCESILTC